MRKVAMTVLAGVTTITMTGAMAQAIYQTDFEAPAFGLGDLNGQDGWSVVEGSAVVQNMVARSGEQAVRIDEESVIARLIEGESAFVVWVESFLRATPTLPPALDPGPRSASLYFDGTQGIMCLDGNGVGGGEWIATGMPAAANQWYKISVRLDFVNQIWDCFVDNQMALTNLGFKDNSITSLSGVAARAAAGGDTYVDDVLAAITAPDGIADSDSDGIPDEIEGGNPAGPGLTNRYLIDSDMDGLFDAMEDRNRNGTQDEGETSGRQRDSDGDGLLDGIEVVILGTDPLTPDAPMVDADGDGLPVGFDLDDTNPDLDGDGISDGYEAVLYGIQASNNPDVFPPLGDVNLDGEVGNFDALVTQALFLNLVGFSDWPGATFSDPDGDAQVGNLDALIMQAHFLGIIPVLPVRL